MRHIGAYKLVPGFIARLPGGEGCKTLIAGVARHAAQVAERARHCRHAVLAEGALMPEKGQGKNGINSVLHAKIIHGLPGPGSRGMIDSKDLVDEVSTDRGLTGDDIGGRRSLLMGKGSRDRIE